MRAPIQDIEKAAAAHPTEGAHYDVRGLTEDKFRVFVADRAHIVADRARPHLGDKIMFEGLLSS